MRWVRLGAATVALLAVLVVAPAPASAHSVLLGTTPADGTVVTAPIAEVTLTFNEPVHADFSVVEVAGPGDATYSSGALTVLDATVHQPVVALRSGAYRVAWRVVSADGHPVSGAFEFTVALPAEPEPTAGPPPTSTATAPAAAGRWWLPTGAALAAVLAVILVLVGRRRRQP